MQINTVWLDELSEKWHVPQSQARKMVRDDPCTNIGVAAWILKNHLNESGGDIAEAIAWYHSHTERHGYKYRKKVIASMKSKGLLKPVR
jgi:soluble lytic murein transglycosylase-like protein